MSNKEVKYTEWLENNWQEGNIMPPPLKPQKALNFLYQYLLGGDWYSVLPAPTEQINCEIVHYILLKYSKKYRKEYKRWENKNE